MNNKTLKLLYKSFDLKLNSNEQKVLEKALESSKKLQAEKQRIESMRKSFSDSSKGTFSPYFAAKVMQKINDINNKKEQNNFLNTLIYDFKIIAAGAAIVLAVLLTFTFISFDNYNENFSVEEITMDKLIEPVAMLEMEDIL